MKKTNFNSALIALVTLFAINGFVNRVSAQTPLPSPIPKCRAVADQIYFVDSGQQVSEVRPGGNGYQLNILGTNTNKFFLVREPHMTSVSLVGTYNNDTQSKWQIYFNPRMGRALTSVKMQSQCTGRAVHDHALTVNVRLLDQ